LRLKAVVSLVIGAKLPLRYAFPAALFEGANSAVVLSDIPTSCDVGNAVVRRSIWKPPVNVTVSM
jgi:hypothetical protein